MIKQFSTGLTLFAALNFSSLAQGAPFKTRLSIDIQDGLEMEAGAQSNWKLNIFDQATGERHTRFMEMHSKNMHLIVVSEDLVNFAHIHPYLNQDTGEFSLGINSETQDPDNVAVQTAVPTAGKYYYFNEIMPMPVNEEMPMVFDRGEFFATQSDENSVKLASNQKPKFEETPATTKFYTSVGELGVEGDEYRVDFSYQQFQFCSIWMPKFYIRISVRDLNSKTGYRPAEDFQRYLGMGGHAIVISKFGDELADKKFYHMHGFLPMSDKGKFTFPYDNHREGIPDGQFKIWSQVRRNDIVFTFSNTFDYVNPPLDEKRKCFL